jgi:hypothetical protein
MDAARSQQTGNHDSRRTRSAVVAASVSAACFRPFASFNQHGLLFVIPRVALQVLAREALPCASWLGWARPGRIDFTVMVQAGSAVLGLRQVVSTLLLDGCRCVLEQQEKGTWPGAFVREGGLLGFCLDVYCIYKMMTRAWVRRPGRHRFCTDRRT